MEGYGQMFKVLIVDDDLLARMGMRMLIDWEAYGYRVIGIADSGEQALELIEKELPDIVFTDVVMQGMDGVELTRRIKSAYPHVLIIALSCYTDVDHVKNIIRVGAEDYLPKLTMRPDDIIAMLSELSAKLEKRQESMQRDDWGTEALLRLVRGEGQDGDERLLQKGKQYRLLAVRKTIGLPGIVQELELTVGLLHARKICCARFRDDLLAALLENRIEDELVALGEEITRFRDKNRPNDVRPLCLGFSPAFSRGSDLHWLFRRAGEASQSSFLYPNERVFFYQDYDKQRMKALYEQVEQINRLLDEGDFEAIPSRANALTGGMSAPCVDPVACRRMYTSLFSKLSQLRLTNNIDNELPCITPELQATVEQCRKDFLRQVEALAVYLSRTPGRYRREVKMAIAYMQEHFSEEISLASIAAHVAMSESRLSTIFKKETGQGMTRYLEQYRIAQAVKLMSRKREPLFMIAQNVGYANVNYFSRVFKKVRGETPSQFLSRQRKMEQK